MRLALILLAGAASAQSWVGQASGTTASLRGISVVNARVAWAAGTAGTWLVTTDGGGTWRSGTVRGGEKLDFRAVHAIDQQTAWLLSVGSGAESRVYHTTDGGGTWRLQLSATDPRGFFDAIAFWDARRGLVLGDPVNGEFEVYATDDAGRHWRRQHTPPALPDEGAFAASNSCLVLRGAHEAWFGTGGPGGARVFHSIDGGGSWTVARTPVRDDGAPAGIFSLAFADGLVGMAVGGDYSKPAETVRNIALTADGGRTWTAPEGAPAGYRSAVLYLSRYNAWIATGSSGSDVSFDAGRSWKTFDAGEYNALGAADGFVLAVGSKGRIAAIRMP
jgi:photosystem II stability/assembly factor-like uncharacterized protein